MKKTSTIELNESAFRNNIDFLRGVIGGSCALSSVVKGNAYGHGLHSFVPMAKRCGIHHFSVFSADEAFQVHMETGGDCRILIMGMIDHADVEWAVENGVEFFVFEPDRLEAARIAAAKLKKPARIHIELETGMNRTGFDREGLKQAKRIIDAHPERFIIEGACTHYAGAESIANHVRIQKQIRSFGTLVNWLEKNDLHPKTKHTACSAAAMSYPGTRMDMVRIGIMQYGFWPSKETLINYLSKRQDKQDPLQRVLSWKSKVMSVKTVKSGEFIGYGTTYMAESEIRVAAVPVGYSHGYSRSLSNTGRVLIGGCRTSVLGLVNMNMMLVDVTHVPEAKLGDEVVLIGDEGNLSISVASFSEMSSQLNYELLTRLPHDIPRTITP